ncbi:MAG TPA: serine hydrolase domain-containing protein [Candidatus Udaeobacter sp.]|nr:serine hydrolase domain-containing protein [Candidatus Udaeobacter sp.]
MAVASRAAVVALLIGFCAAISAKADNIDDYVSARMRQLHIPGLSLAIVRDGRIAKAQGYGFANLELRANATRETVYEIGSNTKQFTAAAIMMLVQNGKLHLEDPITEYFPEAPQAWRTSQFGICSLTPPEFKIMLPFRTG